MTEMELDRRVVGPLEAVHAELRPKQAIGGRDAILVGRAEHQQCAVAQKDELTAGTQQACRLGDPPMWISPDGSAVFTDD